VETKSPRAERLACVAEELALFALHSMRGNAGGSGREESFEPFEEEAFEDTDFKFLHDAKFDPPLTCTIFTSSTPKVHDVGVRLRADHLGTGLFGDERDFHDVAPVARGGSGSGRRG
jgi:hypothetical protein